MNGVELNPHLVDIAKDTRDFLKINNIEFFASSFEQFSTSKKYDLVFSLPNDETIDEETIDEEALMRVIEADFHGQAPLSDTIIQERNEGL